MTERLKVGDRVRRDGTDGEVVAIMTKPDRYGNTHVINSDGISYICMPNGKSATSSNKWVKLPDTVTVYHTLYKTPDSPKLRMLAFLSKNMYEQNLKSLAGAAGYIVVKTWSEEVEIPE